MLTGCPSGCRPEKFPREAMAFDSTDPHLIVVWGGDKINKVPVDIPEREREGNLVHLTSEEVTGLVQEFLSTKNFVLGGLSMRIHSRNALTEYFFRCPHLTSEPYSSFQNCPIHTVDSGLYLSFLRTRP
jgi:hypothetical protein